MSSLPFEYKISFDVIHHKSDLWGYIPRILTNDKSHVKLTPINDVSNDLELMVLKTSINFLDKQCTQGEKLFIRINNVFQHDSVYKYLASNRKYCDRIVFICNDRNIKNFSLTTANKYKQLYVKFAYEFDINSSWLNLCFHKWNYIIIDYLNIINNDTYKKEYILFDNLFIICRNLEIPMVILNVNDKDTLKICKKKNIKYFSGSIIGNPISYSNIKLTVRQSEIADLIKKGLTNKEIANELQLSQYTINNQISKILLNNDLSNRTEIANLY